jgi:hypothetical protein
MVMFKHLFRRKKQKKISFSIFYTTCFMLFFGNSVAQHLIGSYTITTPEASLFSFKPGCLNPAIRSGIFGIGSNPASLAEMEGRSVGLAMILPQAAEGTFSFEAVPETEIYKSISLDSRASIKEKGGFGAIGYAQQNGRWQWGVVMFQPQRSGFNVRVQGNIPIETHYEVDRPLTREDIPDLPVEEIPMTWYIDSNVLLQLSSTPADVYLSIWPIKAAGCTRFGPLSVGIGLNYYRYSSGDNPTRLSSSISGTGTIIGRPYGVDPLTQLPWQGEISADISIADQPLYGEYLLNISGNRFSLSAGMAFNLGPVSLGMSYEHGFSMRMNGSYEFTTIHTSGLPEISELENPQVDWTLRPELSGHVSLDFAEFEKDTIRIQNQGSVRLSGYNGFNLGVRFLMIGLFIGGQVPAEAPEFGQMHFGAYLDFPIPMTPVRFNGGFIMRTDGVYGTGEELIPYRVVTHLGAGFGVRLPLNRWMGIGEKSSWVRFGLRSSLLSMAVSGLEADTQEDEFSSLSETLGASLALEMPLEF